MALVVEFTCELPNASMHVRQATLRTLCNTFTSQIEWHNLRTDRKGNAKSAAGTHRTDTLAGDSCQLLIYGPTNRRPTSASASGYVMNFRTVTRRWQRLKVVNWPPRPH